jgi:phospholipid/cholesterol/gamma-HCH transport system substrate-binding protein
MGRLPERDVRAASERRGIFGWRPSNAVIAIIFLVILILGPYLAFTKHIPFTSYGYEVNATFANGVNIAKNSPVRIAGIEVGKVISTEREGDATKVTFTVAGKGRPIHEDAFAAIRPRIFLEGNFYIDLDPGSPSAPEMDSGGTIPVTHTSTAVQLDEIFTALQSPVRADFSRALQGIGTALAHQPTPAEDATQLPEVKGKTGGEGLNGALKYGGPAGRYGAQVADALTGTTRQDLSRLVASAGRAFGAFVRRDAELEGLIVNFNTFTNALAVQSTNLAETVRRFAPALDTTRTSLVNLNRTLPPLRAWAIELRPSVARLPGLIDASKPWLRQVRPLLSGKEGGGSAKLLSQAVPGLAGAAQAGKAIALPQLNRISLCETQVLQPTFDQTIEDQFSTGGPAYREFFYWLTALAGQTQNFDGNGRYLRIQPSTGDLLLRLPNPEATQEIEQEVFGHSSVAPSGLQPQLGGRPPKKPEVRCDKNPVPNLNGSLGQPGSPALSVITP